MTRRSILFVMMFSSVLMFALACGGSGGSSTPTGTTSGIASGTATPTPPPALVGTFTKIAPTSAVSTIIGNTRTLTWNAAGFSVNLVARVGITNSPSATEALTWFPMTYANGTNSIEWNTTGYVPNVYYVLFKLEVSGIFNYFYSSPITLTTSEPYTVPPTVQLMAPVNAKTIFPNTDVNVSFKVGNADAGVVSQIGIDNDENYSNGVFAWLAATFTGPGTHNSVWSTLNFPNGTFYVVVKATNNNLSTFSYAQPIVIADNINFGEPPVVDIQSPSATVLIAAGTTVAVRFTLSDPDSNATARFILDNDSDPLNGWMSLIYDNVVEGARSYDWVTFGVSPGIYYFLIVASDGVNSTTKYSPAIVVNPAIGLTEPPVITITAPSRPVVLPVGAPLDITGTVIDSDSEAIVQIGIDNDTNFSNGVTSWITTAFTGSFSATWNTTYFPAGVYRVIVLARDGVNEVYKYTDTITLNLLMPSGFNTTKLQYCYNSNIFDTTDMIGAYRSLHTGTNANAGLYHTANSNGTWSTNSVVPTRILPYPVIGSIDTLNELHFNYIYSYFTTRYINNRRLSVATDARVSANNFPGSEPLDLIANDNGNDISLSTSYNGTNLQLIYAKRNGDVVTNTVVLTTNSAASNYNNNWGKMYFNPDGTGYIIARISHDDGSVKNYPVYCIYYDGTTWGSPTVITTQLSDLYTVKSVFNNGSVHVLAHNETNNETSVIYAVCLGANFSTQSIVPPLSVTIVPFFVTWADMQIINNTVLVGLRERNNIIMSTLVGGSWVMETVGLAKDDAAVEWLVTPTSDYIFTSTPTHFGAFHHTVLGWNFEQIRAAEGYLPSVAYTATGDIVAAYRTTTSNEKRLNFARRDAATNTWQNTDLANDCSTFGKIRILVNSASNIYIRYFDTAQYLTLVTFR